MIHNILHISDLHYVDSEDSYLTKEKDKFINELVNEINSVESRIDFLFITGDIADRGVWKGNTKVIELIQKLEKKLKIRNTFCVNGNHDLNKKGKVSSRFNSFRSKLKSSSSTIKYSWFRASEVNKDHWVIEIDCFINGKDSLSGTGYKSLSNSQLLEYETFLNKNLSNRPQTIYFLTHLPVLIDPLSKLNDDSDWKSRHIWQDGKAILERTNRLVDINLLSWFAGDGHVVESYKKPDYQQYFFLTGRFNGPNEKYGTYKDKSVAKEANCQFIRSDSLKKEIVRTIKFSTTREHYESYSVKWYSSTLDFISKTKFVNRYFDTLLQKKLNRTIIDTIASRKLYSLSKATTKEKNVTLGWIDVNGLLNNEAVLQSFLETSDDLLKREFNGDFQNCVLLGLGYWGSSIATILGTSLRIPISCIKVRRIEENNNLVDFVNGKNVFICTDVVASGETLDFIKSVGKFDEISCLITVILNPEIQSKLRDVNKIIYGSNEIAFPKLNQISLPEKILESKYKV